VHVAQSEDWFNIDIVLASPSRAPDRISEVLSKLPKFSFRPRHPGPDTQGVNLWRARLHRGITIARYGEALQNVLLFLKKNEGLLSDFAEEGGEIEIVLNHSVIRDVGKVFELSLSPGFLMELAGRNISLKVQGWQDIASS
jgi:hypothetical protein